MSGFSDDPLLHRIEQAYEAALDERLTDCERWLSDAYAEITRRKAEARAKAEEAAKTKA